MNRSLLRSLDAQSSAALLERVVASADDAVVVVDSGHCIVLYNEGAERMFGYAAAQAIGQSLALLLPEAARQVHASHLQRFASSQPASRRMGERGEIQGRRADGSLFHAEASISHVELAGQVFFTAIVRDVSVRRQADEALARSEARFRGLAEAAPVGIFQTDAAGACTYVNERWCAIAGMGANEALGSGWTRALHPSDRARVHQAWTEAASGAQRFSQKYRFLRPDGTETWVIGNAVTSRGADGGVSGHIGTITDVTESHRQAEALERAKSEAEAAFRAKSLFLANVSHEIRTPLNGVIGMTTLLLDTALTDDQRDIVHTIHSSGQALLEIINDILDYSKVEAGKLEFEERVFDLRRCIEESLDVVTPRAVEKRLNLAYLVDENTPQALVGDASRVRQIVVNLLSNAVKFTPRGEVFVAVDSEPLDGDRHRIRIAVEDTGIGIAAEHQPRLFQSFSQVDASTTRQYGGTGLGLAIVKRLAEMMDGHVSVDSEAGRGSVFLVTLVMRAAAGVPAEHLQRDVPALAGKRLLVVDDNRTNRRILTRLALQWGMLPTTLPSALEALDLVRHGERFDVAVLDASMPDMDGIDLATQIRRLRSAAEMPIVLLTSLGQRSGTTAEPAFAATLSKPIKAGVLYATLVDVVTAAGDMAPSSTPAAAPERLAASLPLRILVAEDNEVNQRVALRVLQHLGYSADTVKNGLEAIEAVERRPYDVVLMDIHMPELDGVQAAQWINARRRDEGRPRIVAMTANAMPGDRESFLAAGMDGYLAKPIEPGAMAQVLRAAMHAAPAATSHHSGDHAVDRRRLADLRALHADGERDLVHDLVDLFVADVPTHLDALDAACVQGDVGRLREVAHRLLSITENIGAPGMSAHCALIEQRARRQTIAGVERAIADLRAEHQRVRELLLAERVRRQT